MACCALCGKKIAISEWIDSGLFYKSFEEDLQKANAYEFKKLLGNGNYCYSCMENYRLFKKEENIEETYRYFKEIISFNSAHVNIDINKFDDLIESLYSSYSQKEKLKKENKFIIQKIDDTVLERRAEFSSKYGGSSWFFPKLSKNGHMGATKNNGNLIMVENWSPTFSFTNEVENSKNIQDNVNSMDDEDLFMASIIPLDNIVSFQLIGDVEHVAMVSGGGGGGGQPNLRGAAVGGLLFGGAGAIIGAQTGICINPISSAIKEFDSRVTLLNLKNAEGQVEIRELPYYYSEVFMKVIPEKEFNFLQANKNAETPAHTQNTPALNMVEEMKQLKELLELGLITQEEYDSKRQQILKL